MKFFRFTIRRMLMFITLVAIMIISLLPPYVSFGKPKFTAMPALYTFWGDVPTRVVSRIAVTNQGLLPVWYPEVDSRGWAEGTLESTVEVLSNSKLEIRWKILRSGESVVVREYCLEGDDKLGVRLMDWTGRLHVILNHDVDLAPVWLERESLPEEIPDPE